MLMRSPFQSWPTNPTATTGSYERAAALVLHCPALPRSPQWLLGANRSGHVVAILHEIGLDRCEQGRLTAKPTQVLWLWKVRDNYRAESEHKPR
jgi:hypothetical protein